MVNHFSESLGDYIAISGEDLGDADVSQYTEGVAYHLYKNRKYLTVNASVMHYIFKVISRNIQLGYYGQEEGVTLVGYLYNGGTQVVNSLGDTEMYTYRPIEITSDEDIIAYGSEDFIHFMKDYYAKSFVRWSTYDYGATYFRVENQKFLDSLVFLKFLVEKEVGLMTAEGYDELRDWVLELSDRKKGTLRKDNTIKGIRYNGNIERQNQMIKRCYNLVENTGVVLD